MSQRFIVTGRTTESASRVVHNLRPAGPASSDAVQVHVADLVTTEENALELYSEVDVVASHTVVPAAAPTAPPTT